MRKAALYRWMIFLFLGICLLLMAFAGVTLLKGSVDSFVTASAASEYWSTPSTCPGCGASKDSYQTITFSKSSGCTYTYEHLYMSNPNPMCSGTVTIHSARTYPGQEPTCTQAGQASFVRCSSCGVFQSSPTTIPALGHDYGDWFVATSATCTQNGIEQRQCSRCSARETRTLVATGHSYTWTTTSSATCTSGGTRRGTCSKCGDTTTSTTSALGHSMRSTTYSATCTSGGYTYHYCSRCSYSYTSNETSALGHNWGSYTQTKAPTCTATGTETAECTRCDATTSRTIAALGHSSVTDPAVAATCTATGLTEGSHCSRCDAVLTAQETVPALGHNWGSYTQTKAPTCTATGTETATCTRCDATTSRSIDALGHDLEHHAAQAATCTEIGWNAYDTCSRCDYTTYVELAVLGHTPGPAATCTTAQTCTECGAVLQEAEGHILGPDATCTEDQVCLVCGAVLSAAEGHTAGAAATCTAAQTCTVCGEVLSAALGHDLIQHAAKAPTCTAIGWEAYETCSRCDYTTYEELSAKGHTAGPAATCTTAQTCTVCGEVLNPAKGHTPGAAATCISPQICTECGAVLQAAEGHTAGPAATCTEDQVCLVCDAVLQEAKGHIPGAAATCTTPQTCTVCGTVLQEAKGHILGPDATCTEDQVCLVCGEVISAAEGHIPGPAATCTTAQTCSVCGTQLAAALGHSPVTDEAIAATCTTAGKTQGSHCSRCNEVLEAQDTIPALGHDWGAYVQTKAPTCTETGTETATCTRCDATTSRTLAALGHAPVTDEAVAATCTNTGLTAGSHCSRCDAVIKAQQTVPALGHDYGAYVQTKAPTCTQAGTETATCTRCGAMTSRDVEALGHTPVTDQAVAATCTNTGLTQGSHCSRCEEVLMAQEVIPALGHDWGEYTQTKAPTCTENGVETSECSRCGETQTRDIEALGHIEVTDEAVAATCTSSGKTEGTHCSRCNEVLEAQEVIPALGHDWGAYVETKAPTCTETGVETSACSRCDATQTRTLAATGHTLGPDATCTEDQVCLVCGAVLSAAEGHIAGPAATCTTAQTCTVCGEVLSAALGHDLIQHAAKAPTCTAIGWEAYETCSRCDYTTYEELAALGHTAGAAATCTTVQTCMVCGEVLHAALGHDLIQHAAKAPTCTEIGWEAYETCSRCDYTTYEELAALGHTAGAAATCTTPQTCTVCGEVLHAALGHDLSQHDAKAPTCTEIGWNAYETCSRCDYTTYEELEAKGHTPGAAATCTTAQTCTECGIELNAALGHTPGDAPTCTAAQICTVCGAELAAELGHVNVIDEAVPATCTDTGLTEGAHCSRCEEVLLAQTETEALGHFLLAAEDSRVNCTDEGTLTRHCARCDYSEVREVSGGMHSWRPGRILAESTCTEAGVQQLLCAFCGETNTAELPKLSHKVITMEAIPATCTSIGMTGGIMCAVCGTVLLARDEVPALGHSLSHVPMTAPTAETEGMAEHYACGTCGGLFADENGEQAVTADDLRIPAGSPDDGGDKPLPEDSAAEDEGMGAFEIALAALFGVLLVAVIFMVIAKLTKKEKRR